MIQLDPQEFSKIATIARAEAGLDLSDSKIGMVHARLQRRLRKLGLKDYRSYCTLLETGDSRGEQERQNLIEALTTNVTSLFREAHHFPILVNEHSAWENRQQTRPFRVWSAGCSNGSEPTTVCLALGSANSGLQPSALEILGTDIDGTALNAAADGIYATGGLPDDVRDRCGHMLDFTANDRFRLKPAWRQCFRYSRASLLDPPIDPNPFDVVFCRNVTIYFDSATSARVQRHLLGALRLGGLLFLGHSERPADPGLEQQCQRVGPTAYRKV